MSEYEQLREKINQAIWEAMHFARGCSEHAWETQPNSHKVFATQILAAIAEADYICVGKEVKPPWDNDWGTLPPAMMRG